MALVALTGDSGILNNAESAKNKTNSANVKEKLALMAQGALTESYEKGESVITKDNLVTELNRILGKSNYEIEDFGKKAWTITFNGLKFYIAQNGKIINLQEEELPITSALVHDDLKTYLGQPINYTGTYTDVSSYGNGKWEIFYADEDHIYIITKGIIAGGPLKLTDSNGNSYKGTIDFTDENSLKDYPAVQQGLLNKTYDPESKGSELKCTSTGNNMKATQYLLDSNNWSTYAKDIEGFADWAIGGPTLELFVKSYNAYYPDNTVILGERNNIGYTIPSGFTSFGGYFWRSNYYWVAAPIDVEYASDVGVMRGTLGYGRYYSYSGIPFRPVVCLDSNVKITWNSESSQYDISWVNEN